MAKIRSSKYRLSDKESFLSDVFSIAMTLRDKKELVDFFHDVLFDSEIIMLGRRLQIAKMLLANETYEEIRRQLRVGINTITAVRYSLDNGSGQVARALERFLSNQK